MVCINIMQVLVRGVYFGFLSSVETKVSADLWMSSPAPDKSSMANVDLSEADGAGAATPVVQEFWEKVAGAGYMRMHRSSFSVGVDLQWGLDTVPADTALHVQVFASLDERALGHPNLGMIPAGSAHVLLKDLLSHASVAVPIVHQSLQDEPIYKDTADAQKGVFVLSAVLPEDVAVQFAEPTGSSLLYERSDELQGAVLKVIQGRTSRATSGKDESGRPLPPTLPEMRRVRAEDYATPAGINILDSEFFTMHNVPPPDPDTVWMYFKRSAGQQGWSVATLGRCLRDAVKTERPWGEAMVVAQEVFVRALTMAATAIYYSSDFAVVHERGCPRLLIVESFDDAMRRGVADCEDFSKLIALTFLFLRDKIDAREPWQSDVQYFARAFVCVITLRSVCSAALDHVRSAFSTAISLNTPIQMDQAGAHMNAVLYPVGFFEACCSRGHKSFGGAAPPIAAASPSPSQNLVPLFCEGTGPMKPFLDGASWYTDDEAGKNWQRRQIAAERVLMHPESLSGLRLVLGRKFSEAPPPESLRFLRSARTVLHAQVDGMDTAHNFYRVAGDGFVPGMDVGSFDDGGVRMTLSKFTYCVEQGGKLFRGVPIMAEARASSSIAFRFFPAPPSDVTETMDNVRLHIPPMTRLDARDPPAQFYDLAREITDVFMDGVGEAKSKVVKAISHERSAYDAEGVVVVMHRFVRTTDMTHERVCAVADLVRANTNILEVAVSSAVLCPTAWQTDFVFKVFVPAAIVDVVSLP